MLPKLDVPVYEVKLISTDKTIRFRPFLVKEQKLFLMASESDDQKETVNVIRQVLKNCILDEIDVDNLSTFDLRSVNNSYHNYFINFIQKLNRLCGVGCPGKFSRIHDYTSSSDYTGNELLNNDRFQIITVDAIGEVNLKNRLSNNGPSKKYKANNISKRSLFSNNN